MMKLLTAGDHLKFVVGDKVKLKADQGESYGGIDQGQVMTIAHISSSNGILSFEERSAGIFAWRFEFVAPATPTILSRVQVATLAAVAGEDDEVAEKFFDMATNLFVQCNELEVSIQAMTKELAATKDAADGCMAEAMELYDRADILDSIAEL